MAGPRYRPFQFVWNRFSWSGFLIRKERLYDRIYAAVAATMIAFTVIQGCNVLYVWQEAIQHNYRHYLRKERTRNELAEKIRIAREQGLLPPKEETSSLREATP